ncbi:MAG: gliding motility-associated C-terminal domain-containing protein [Bacteroidales bacterium]|jgi:gliding motility-associated-like protein
MTKITILSLAVLLIAWVVKLIIKAFRNAREIDYSNVNFYPDSEARRDAIYPFEQEKMNNKHEVKNTNYENPNFIHRTLYFILFLLFAIHLQAQTSLQPDNTVTIKPIIKESIADNENISTSVKQTVPIVPNYSSVISVENKKNTSEILAKAQQWLSNQNNKGFIENKGQMIDMDGNLASHVLFRAESPGIIFWITDKGITIETMKIRKEEIPVSKLDKSKDEEIKMRGKQKTKKFIDWERIDVELNGARIQKNNIIKEMMLQGHFNYFLPNCPDGINEVKEYEKITIKNVYRGIDWVFYRKEDGTLKYDFIVNPDADYRQIELLYKSKTPVKINESGQLELYTIYGNIKENTPVSFYDGKEIKTNFTQNNTKSLKINEEEGFETSVKFNISSLNGVSRKSQLVIDPQIVWHTLYGSNNFDGFTSIKEDNAGNIFIGGYFGEPAMPPLYNSGDGAYFQGTGAGGHSDALILKFSPSGILLWGTAYGGDGYDQILDFAVDAAGNLFATGCTGSTDFPIFDASGGAYFQNTFAGGQWDAFILKFSNKGVRLWATYYGGNGNMIDGDDMGKSIAIDSHQNIFITGYTRSSAFPVQSYGSAYYQAAKAAIYGDAFILKFNNSGVRLWATYYGGGGTNAGHVANSITVDNSDNFIITGCAGNASIPTYNPGEGAYYKSGNAGMGDVFICKMSNTGTMLWATNYGGSDYDDAYGVITDNSGNIFVCGHTRSKKFPLLNPGNGAFFQGSHGGGFDDAFILKFKSNGVRLWATYYGGNSPDGYALGAHPMAIDNCDNLYVGFLTMSSNITTMTNVCSGYQDNSYNGSAHTGLQGAGFGDIFLTKFTNTCVLNWATFWGGNGTENRINLLVNRKNYLLAVGECMMEGEGTYGATYPTLVNPGGGAYFDNSYNGWDDSFIVKFGSVYTKNQVDATTCACNGTATVTISGACPNYSYVWSNGQQTLNTSSTSNTATALCPGNYSVTVSSYCMPDTVLYYTLTGGTGSMSLTATGNTICSGVSATITASGANFYTWSNNSNSSTQAVSPTITTTYIVTGSDGAGCTGTASCIVTVSNNLTLTTTGSTICNGKTATITVSGGNTYTWNNNSSVSSQTVSPTITTTYYVTGKNVSGCTGTAQAVVLVNPLPYITTMGNLICAGNSANMIAGGATTYTWSTNQMGSTIAVTPTITTTYMVTGINGNNCTNTAQAVVIVNPKPNITANPATICNGASVNITASNGTTYTWNTGYIGNPLNVMPAATITYTVTGTDGNGCTNTVQAIVTVNNKPNVTATGGTICTGGNINISANNATTYTWNTGSTNNPYNVNPTSTTIYSVTGTDANSCTNTSQATVAVNNKPNVTATGGSTCPGSPINVVGGNGTNYTWSTGFIDNPLIVTPTAAATYTVTGVDVNGCTNTAQATVSLNPTISINTTNPAICFGATTVVSAFNGVSYTWNISLTGSDITVAPTLTTTYTVTGVNASGCSGTGQATVTVNPKPIIAANGTIICNGANANITAINGTTYTWNTGFIGNPLNVTPSNTTTYTVTGTDANQCTNIATAAVTVNPKPDIAANGTTICNGASVNITASNGTTYTWNTGFIGNPLNVTPANTTTYSVTGTDGSDCTNTTQAIVTVNPKPTVTANSPIICDGATTTLTGSGATTYTWSPGGAGTSIVVTPTITTTYTVTGTDGAGCTNTAVATVAVNVKPNITAAGGTICNGGNVNISASNANTYTWDTGSNNNPYNVSPTATTIYNVTGTDGEGCTNTAQTTVTVNQKPNITANGTTICNGASVNITASNGTTYTWNTGFIGNPLNVTPANTTTYSVTGTDGSDCTNTTQAIVTVNAKPNVTANSPIICDGATTTLTGSGATTYTWSPGGASTSIVVTPVATTTYQVTGTDGNGCTNIATATVTVNPKPNITVAGGTICNGGNVNISASNANTYTWNTGSNNNPYNVSPTTTTIYNVTGTDGEGCTNTAQTTVTVNPKPNITANGTTICNGANANITAINGATYIWNTGFIGNPLNVTPTTTTTYSVTGTDGNGCTNTGSAIITVYPNPVISEIVNDEICLNNSGSVKIDTSGGASYTYSWNNGKTTNPLDSLSQGTYTVTVTDSHNCKSEKTITVNNIGIYPNGEAAVDSIKGLITHVFKYAWNGNSGNTYDWDFGDSTHSTLENPTHIYEKTGKYHIKIKVTTQQGCESEYDLYVEVINPSDIEVFNITTPNSDGLNDIFKVKYKGEFSTFSMMIFNRWGVKLFETSDINSGWDARNHSDGTYYYIIKAKATDNKEYDFHGNVTVIR